MSNNKKKQDFTDSSNISFDVKMDQDDLVDVAIQEKLERKEEEIEDVESRSQEIRSKKQKELERIRSVIQNSVLAKAINSPKRSDLSPAGIINSAKSSVKSLSELIKGSYSKDHRILVTIPGVGNNVELSDVNELRRTIEDLDPKDLYRVRDFVLGDEIYLDHSDKLNAQGRPISSRPTIDDLFDPRVDGHSPASDVLGLPSLDSDEVQNNYDYIYDLDSLDQYKDPGRILRSDSKMRERRTKVFYPCKGEINRAVGSFYMILNIFVSVSKKDGSTVRSVPFEFWIHTQEIILDLQDLHKAKREEIRSCLDRLYQLSYEQRELEVKKNHLQLEHMRIEHSTKREKTKIYKHILENNERGAELLGQLQSSVGQEDTDTKRISGKNK